MAILRPDEYQHQNPDLAIADSSRVRGGRRVVANRAGLYALASKADQLKEQVTIVRILSDGDNGGVATEVLLVNATAIGSAAGWALYSTGGNSNPGNGGTSAGPYLVKYLVTVGQTSIGPNEVPALANATGILSISNAASDGHKSPLFDKRTTQANTTQPPEPGYWFDAATHTIQAPAALFDKAYTLSIEYVTGVVGTPGGQLPDTFDPVDLLTAMRQAVVDGFAAQDAAGNDSPFLSEPQPDGSLVGMFFYDPQANYKYEFGPVPFADGCFNVWCSLLLSR